MPKIIEGAKAFVLMYYPCEEDSVICEIYASAEKATAEKRRRNKAYCEHECLTPEGDFNYEQYDSSEYSYYDVAEFTLIV